MSDNTNKKAPAIFATLDRRTGHFSHQALERPVVINGVQTTEIKPVPPTVFTDGVFITASDKEIDLLRDSPFNEANGGTGFREVESMEELTEMARLKSLEGLPADPRDAVIAQLQRELEIAKSAAAPTIVEGGENLLDQLLKQQTAAELETAAKVAVGEITVDEAVAETAAKQAETPATSEDAPAPVMGSQGPATTGAGANYADVTTATDAAQILAGLGVPLDAMKVSGRITKDRIREVAAPLGVDFPNL